MNPVASTMLGMVCDKAIAEFGTPLEVRMPSRLAEKLKAARETTQRILDKIEAEADQLIAREATLDKRREEAFKPHYGLLDEAKAELDAVEEELRQMSNSPLPGSKSTGG